MRSPANGFTLAELLTCLAVVGVVLAIGLPVFSGMREHVAALNTLHSLTVSLNSARMAAVMRRTPVTVCPSRDGLHCRDDLRWEDGWLVYVDPKRLPQPEGPERILQQVESVGGPLMLRSSVGRHRVRYQPTGLAGGNNVTLRLCSRRGVRALGEVVVNLAGRPRSRRFPGSETPCPYPP